MDDQLRRKEITKEIKREIKKFQKTIWEHYRAHGRDFAWRRTRDPYKILVSEIMLQQTQVSRVAEKYKSFLQKFPTVQVLARAPLADVLTEWQGLGYNRRALFLKRCAETIAADFAGRFPRDFKTLCSLPGIGPATAGDIMAFAWNLPVPVIETNIRSVFIHFFFAKRAADQKISDAEILPLVQKTLDTENPREWYWALFDYGAHLKTTLKKSVGGNPGRKSAHHTNQSRFEGSMRQKRAAILRAILVKPQTEADIQKAFKLESNLTQKILSDLSAEGFVTVKNNLYQVR
jgi:A/G-specific adenine glycosylase